MEINEQDDGERKRERKNGKKSTNEKRMNKLRCTQTFCQKINQIEMFNFNKIKKMNGNSSMKPEMQSSEIAEGNVT